MQINYWTLTLPLYQLSFAYYAEYEHPVKRPTLKK